MVEKYIYKTSVSKDTFLLCYFDLDNFKAFNDVYGFRNGDRVIQLFADIMKKNLSKEYFIGHIGGDDFFTAVTSEKNDEYKYLSELQNIVTKFTNDVVGFYSQQDKERGYIISKDRDGNVKKFKLLSVSASILIIHKKTKKRCLTNIDSILSVQKKVAKTEFKHISMSCLL